MTLTIEIEHNKQKSLESIAAREGKNVAEVVKEILDKYLAKESFAERSERLETNGLMGLSETAFVEWDNEEDSVYDKL